MQLGHDLVARSQFDDLAVVSALDVSAKVAAEVADAYASFSLVRFSVVHT
jgi:hypothetical protein